MSALTSLFDYDVTLVSMAMAVAVAFVTPLIGITVGAMVAWHAKPGLWYGTQLTLYLLPFAVGASVYAYSITNVVALLGLQAWLVRTNEWSRFAVVLLCCLLRTIPLAVFFAATSLHRDRSRVATYLRAHDMPVMVFASTAMASVPSSVAAVIGGLSGAVAAAEASLPLFLYRANPGTQPELLNLMLSRVYREEYGFHGPSALPSIAAHGALLSVGLLLSVVLAAMGAKALLSRANRWMIHRHLLASRFATTLVVAARVAAVVALIPGVIAIAGLVPRGEDSIKSTAVLPMLDEFRPIITLGLVVSMLVVGGGLAVAVALRYGPIDRLQRVWRAPIAAGLLLWPAFVPTLTIVAVIGVAFAGAADLLGSYAAVVTGHVSLQYPLFQYLTGALVLSVPDRRVAWQRAVRMAYSFSLLTDGFRRHSAALVALWGMCAIQIVTDGSVARWFSHTLPSPSEALQAAVFGRLASMQEAMLVAVSTGLFALGVAMLLAFVQVQDLKRLLADA